MCTIPACLCGRGAPQASPRRIITTPFLHPTTGGSLMDMNRRHFFRVSGAGLVGSSLVAMGFSPATALAEVRQYKLAATTVTRQTH